MRNSASQNRSKISFDPSPGNDTTMSVDVDPLTDDADMRIATGVGALVRPVGAVGISERLPPLDHDGELVEPQRLGMPDQQLRGLRELCGAPRVGVHPSQQPRLSDTQSAGMRRYTCLGNGVQQPGVLHHCLRLGLRGVTRRLHPPGHRRSVHLPRTRQCGRQHPPPQRSDASTRRRTPSNEDSIATEFPRLQTLQVGNLWQLDRTHVPILAEGCDTVLSAR